MSPRNPRHAGPSRPRQHFDNTACTIFEGCRRCRGRMTVPFPAPRGRDPWLDNARFILIALVVFGHMLEPLADAHPWLQTCYRFVYAFHMPAFAFRSEEHTSELQSRGHLVC